MVRWNRMKFGDNNSNTLGECMLKFVQNGACLHFWVQKVWGAHFFWTHCICTGEQVLWSWCVRVFVRGVSRNALYKCTILTYLLTYLLVCKIIHELIDACQPNRVDLSKGWPDIIFGMLPYYPGGKSQQLGFIFRGYALRSPSFLFPHHSPYLLPFLSLPLSPLPL